MTTVVGQRAKLNYFESSGYWEAPVGEADAIVLAPWVEQNSDSADGWRGEATLAVKHALVRTHNAAMAVQAGALWVSHPHEGCGEGGVEARWLGGVSFGGSGFANLEGATRTVEGGCGGERLELTTGYRPADNWLAMAQVFYDTGRDAEENLKGQLTLVRFGDSGRGVQVGVRARLDGDEPEPALVLGFWGRPGR